MPRCLIDNADPFANGKHLSYESSGQRLIAIGGIITNNIFSVIPRESNQILLCSFVLAYLQTQNRCKLIIGNYVGPEDYQESYTS